MKVLNYKYSLIVLFSSLLFYSCASAPLIDNPEAKKEQVLKWEQRVNTNPNDAEALKDLSIYYVQTHQNEKAEKYIDNALKQNPTDASLILFKGLILESFNKQSAALDFYKRYTEVPQESPYRDLIEGRYLWIKRQQTYSDIDSLIKNENTLSVSKISDNTLAVFPLIYQGTNNDYVPLSRGFSEMISIDLAKVKGLTILERIRIQALLDELKFGQSSIVDQSTAPRVGKLLRAGRIVSGDYNVTGDGIFKINLGSWNVQTRERKSWVNKSGDLKDFFILQKEVVFAFLEKNNIDLTQAEKEAIAYIPTQNLESFLAFSKGLAQEDAGNFKGAATYFQRAVELDPNFNAAGEKLKSSQAIDKGSGTQDQMLSVLEVQDVITTHESNQLVDDRTKSLGDNISTNFHQGIDSRSPAQEGSSKTNAVLPPPPPPPNLK